MIIVNERKNIIVFTEALISINIHSGGYKILARFEKQGQQDATLAEYDDKKKAARAFGLLSAALSSGAEYYEMPDNADATLNTKIQGDYTQRKVRTTGKTK